MVVTIDACRCGSGSRGTCRRRRGSAGLRETRGNCRDCENDDTKKHAERYSIWLVETITQTSQVEPWLEGALPGFHPVISHLLRSSQQIRGEIDRWIAPAEDEIVWATGTGFHVKHLAGSTDRLCTYLAGKPLTEAQLAVVANEHTPSPGLAVRVHLAFERYESLLKSLYPEEFSALRYVGRKRIPVTAISLAIHIAEHGQRHVGQAISLLRTK